MNNPSRRKLLKHTAALGAVAALSRSTVAAVATTKPASTQSTSLTAEDLLAADNVLGHDFTSKEREMAIDSMTSKRKLMLALRTRHIDPNVEPAVHFNPRLPGTVVPSGQSSFALSPSKT